MKPRLLVFFLWISFAVHLTSALAATDERLQPITRSEITVQIAQIPLNSPKQVVILLRAGHSHLLDTAYSQYTLLWNKQPKDSYANLLRGLSAELFFEDSMDLKLQRLYGLHSARTELFLVAQSCLKTAFETAPKCAEAKMEYGYYLWQFGNEMEHGISLLKEAAKLAPNDPRIHATLGLVYSNQTGNAYSVNQAIAELTKAAQLDPSYAFPHAMLTKVYRWQHQDAQSKKENLIFESLLPKSDS